MSGGGPARLYCIGHVAPVFAPPVGYTFVGPGIAGPEDAIVMPDDMLGDEVHHRTLAEYFYLFGLAPEIAALPPGTPVYLFQYRKFLSLRPGRRQATNQAYAFTCPPGAAAALFPGAEELAGLAQDRIVGPFVHTRSLAGHYARFHWAEDFATFILALSEVEGFDRRRCRAFAECAMMFPAPTLGLARAGRLAADLGVLRAAWEAGVAAGIVPRPGYQRRTGGFLLERLHSFLVYEALAGGGETALIANHVVVTGDGRVRPTT